MVFEEQSTQGRSKNKQSSKNDTFQEKRVKLILK